MKYLFGAAVFVIILLTGTVYAQSAPFGPLQGTFMQTSAITCVPTGLGVLADTADVSPWIARSIAREILGYCTIKGKGIYLTDGVWGLIKTLNQSGGTTPGGNATIIIYGTMNSTKKIPLTDGSTGGGTVTLIQHARIMTGNEIGGTTGGGSGGSTGGKTGGSTGGGTGGGGTPVGIVAGGHFVIIVSVDLEHPSPAGSGHNKYPVIFWDPLTNSYLSGSITDDGKHFYDGLSWSPVKGSVIVR